MSKRQFFCSKCGEEVRIFDIMRDKGKTISISRPTEETKRSTGEEDSGRRHKYSGQVKLLCKNCGRK